MIFFLQINCTTQNMSAAELSALTPAAPPTMDHPPPYQPNPSGPMLQQEMAELKVHNSRLFAMLERMIMHALLKTRLSYQIAEKAARGPPRRG